MADLTAFQLTCFDRHFKQRSYLVSPEKRLDRAIRIASGILSYDRRAARRRFEERFTATRMAEDYVSTYRRLLKARASGVKPHQLGRNGGNGSTFLSIGSSLPVLFELGADPEVPI